MSGAMAGTTILHATTDRVSLVIVTLTINNACNLHCPHCYLDDAGQDIIGDEVVEAVIASTCEHISIVGKEPFANRRSIACVEQIVARAIAAGKTVSVITNGLNGALIPARLIQQLAWIDISLDGGADSYEQYRGGSWRRLIRSIEAMRTNGARDVRVLQTLSKRTAPFVDDMVRSSRVLGASLIMFSPFRPTRALGAQADTALEPDALVDCLSAYFDDGDIRLSVDSDYTAHFADVSLACARAKQAMGKRFCYVPTDPIHRGIIRVTHDGKVMTPLQAIHVQDYGHVQKLVGGESLDSLFQLLLNCGESAPSFH